MCWVTGGARKKARKSGDDDGPAPTEQAAGAKKPRKGQSGVSKRGGKRAAPTRPQHITLDGGESDGGSDLSGQPLATRVARAVSVQPIDGGADRRKATGSQPCATDSHPGVTTAGDGHAAAERTGADSAAATLSPSTERNGAMMPDQALSPGRKDLGDRLPDPGLPRTSMVASDKAVVSGSRHEQCSSPPPLQPHGQPVPSTPPSMSPCRGGDVVVPQTPESQVRLCSGFACIVNMPTLCLAHSLWRCSQAGVSTKQTTCDKSAA